MSHRHDDSEYFSGLKLIGDDFNDAEIQEWYEQEKNAYVSLIDTRESYYYEYHALNEACAFSFIKQAPRHSMEVCGFGSAFGDELKPIQHKIVNTVLIESASSFHERPQSKNVRTVLAQSNGVIGCDTNSFDLITCFGVLHHIPNVSFVISELHRCLASGGILMVREPTTSMGDWRVPRVGVTKNERGIPSTLLREIICKAGFEILKHSPCVFPPLAVLSRKVGIVPYNSKIVVFLDLLLCWAFRWNYRYHRTGLIHKFAPASDFYVCRKL
jgi:SAM-dependent methyltransferase